MPPARTLAAGCSRNVVCQPAKKWNAGTTRAIPRTTTAKPSLWAEPPTPTVLGGAATGGLGVIARRSRRQAQFLVQPGGDGDASTLLHPVSTVGTVDGFEVATTAYGKV